MIDRRGFLRFTFGSAMAATIGSRLIGCGSGAPRDGGVRGSGQAGTVTPPAPGKRKATACILLYMNGGPSQLDTFDPKPGHANAGGVKAMATPVAGIQVSELLPLLARQAQRLAIVRSIVSKEGNHARARHLMHTGYAPAGGVKFPAFGSIAAAELGKPAQPGYISLNGPGGDAGFLGAAYAPFAVPDPGKPVRNLGRHRLVDDARFADRVALWNQLEDGFAATHDVPLVRDQRAVMEQGMRLMGSAQAQAFDSSAEPESIKQQYGDSRLGLGCLAARRLVEAGVPFIEVMQPGWDTHEKNLERVTALCADLDRAMSALLADLAGRGLLETTLVVWAGDFGRTPRLNERGGRDHYPQVTPAVLAGGGVRGGVVIGATDAGGETVTDGAVTVADFYRTIAVALGIDPDEERISTGGRPIATVDGGTPIRGLIL